MKKKYPLIALPLGNYEIMCIHYLSTVIGQYQCSVIICSIYCRIVDGHNPSVTDDRMNEEGQIIPNIRAEDPL